MPILFMDLETTGLKATADSILEVACIVTDDQLNESARFHRVVYTRIAAVIHELLEDNPSAAWMRQVGHVHGVDPVVVEMHHMNGLWAESRNGVALDTADRDLEAFIRQHGITFTQHGDDPTTQEPHLPQLAGASVHFDRAFVEKHMCRTAALLHHRQIDVSTFNETAWRFWPDLHAQRPKREKKAHRALADIEESIACYKFYLAHLAALRDGDKILRVVEGGKPLHDGGES